MEKTNKTNKKKGISLLVLLVVILLCVAVVLGMGGFTYAKYVSSKSVSSTTANVAKWGYVVSVDSSKLFGEAYEKTTADSGDSVTNQTVIDYPDDVTASVGVLASTKGTDAKNLLVAPGTEGYVTFSITGSAEVRSKITIEAPTGTTVRLTWTENDEDKTYEPIRWTLGENSDGGNTYTPVDGWEDGKTYSDMIDALGDLSVANIDPNTAENLYYKLSWAWDFQTVKTAEVKNGDGHVTSPATYCDLEDTVLGAIMSGASTTDKDGNAIAVSGFTATVGETVYTATTSVSLDFKITVEQIQEANAPSKELKAGLYNANHKLLVSYSESGMNVTKDYTGENYQTETTSPRYILNHTYTSTEYIVLPDDITHIGNFAFEGCTKLKGVTIPDSVTSIGKNAFQDCKALESITIPDSVTSIGNNAFNGCEALTSVTIGSGVNVISKYAFNACSKLTSITIPDNVGNIAEYAFEGCSSLKSVTIGSGVGLIKNDAFNGCTDLTSVYYKGTNEASWNKITIQINNSYLTGATIYYYSESEPTEDGNYWHYDTDGVTPVVWTKETETE